MGADFAAGVGPSIGIGVARRMAIAGAERAGTSVTVAYLSRGAFEMGHNVVGIRQGATTAWVHFAGLPTGSFVARAAPGGEYVLTELAVGGAQAESADAARRLLIGLGPQTWGYLGPNCSTTTLQVLRAAGIVMPEWARTPALVHLGLRAGAEITIVGGAAAAAAPGVAPARPAGQHPQRPRYHKDGHLLIHGHYHRKVAAPIVLPPKG